MPWNGSGVYSVARNWTADKAAGIAPSAANFDQQDADIAAAINNCVAKDGQNTMTGPLKMAGQQVRDATSVRLYNAAGATNEKYSQLTANNNSTEITLIDDALSSVQSALLIQRTGNVPTTVTIGGTTLICSAAVSSGNAANAMGTKGAPSRSISATDNTAASDAGKTIVLTGGTAQTFTLDSDPPVDSIVRIVNKSGNSWTIAASGTLRAAGATGSITLATNTGAEFYHEGSGNWTRTS
jgi:hypothetical protein